MIHVNLEALVYSKIVAWMKMMIKYKIEYLEYQECLKEGKLMMKKIFNKKKLNLNRV